MNGRFYPMKKPSCQELQFKGAIKMHKDYPITRTNKGGSPVLNVGMLLGDADN